MTTILEQVNRATETLDNDAPHPRETCGMDRLLDAVGTTNFPTEDARRHEGQDGTWIENQHELAEPWDGLG